jgi:alpha-L-arabinofuranosidase
LDLLLSSPTYKVGNRRPLPYLDVSATFDRGNRLVYLNVLNRSEKMDITARICGICPVAYQISSCNVHRAGVGRRAHRWRR